MNPVVVICGYGPGIAHAMARRFGMAGYPVALVARSADRLDRAVSELVTESVTARAFPADLGGIDAANNVIERIRSSFGSIGLLHWNAFKPVHGRLLATAPADLQDSFSVRVAGFMAALQASVDDLENNEGAILATSGVIALDTDDINAFGVDYGALGITVAAQHKAMNILKHDLAPRGIFTGEVIVNGFVRNTAGSFEQDATIVPNDVAEAFWNLWEQRRDNAIVLGRTVPLDYVDA